MASRYRVSSVHSPEAAALCQAAGGLGFPPTQSSERALWRLVRSRGAVLFARNSVASFFSFAFDMLLLWLLVEAAGWDKFVAATAAFLAAITLHYALCRLWVFHGSSRSVVAGYFYFLVNAGAGLLITLGLFALLAEVAGVHYLLARVLASIVAGFAVFLLNAYLNFKSL